MRGSIRQIAEHLGESEATLRRRIARGALKVGEDGAIDAEEARKAIGHKRKGMKVRVPAAEAPETAEAAPPALTDADVGGVSEAQIGALSYDEAERIKENYLAGLRRNEFHVRTGQLVDATSVAKAQFEMARRVRDQIAGWPSREAPVIAAEVGCDAIALTIALERSLGDLLSSLATGRV